MTDALWRFEAFGPAHLIDPAADRACDADPALALAVAVFDHEPGTRRLELLFDAMPDPDALERALGLALHKVEIAFGPLPDEDWVALSLEGLEPVVAGRFFVHGSHSRPRRGGTVALLIEAGMAFGTGHHGTTRGCLLAFEALLKRAEPTRILDVGTGTGVLAIAAAKALKCPVLATDIDADAVTVTRENAAANGVAGLVKAIRADGVKDPRIAGAYDVVFANILAGPLQSLAGDLAGTLAPGGRVILSGLLEPQERAVVAAYLNRGLVREARLALEGWVTLVLRRPPADTEAHDDDEVPTRPLRRRLGADGSADAR